MAANVLSGVYFSFFPLELPCSCLPASLCAPPVTCPSPESPEAAGCALEKKWWSGSSMERGGRAVMGVFAKASLLLHNHNTQKLGYQLGTVLACSFPEHEELCHTGHGFRGLLVRNLWGWKSIEEQFHQILLSVKNFPDAKDEQRCILEAVELYLFERTECRGQRAGPGRNSVCHPAALWRRGAFFGDRSSVLSLQGEKGKITFWREVFCELAEETVSLLCSHIAGVPTLILQL